MIALLVALVSTAALLLADVAFGLRNSGPRAVRLSVRPARNCGEPGRTWATGLQRGRAGAGPYGSARFAWARPDWAQRARLSRLYEWPCLPGADEPVFLVVGGR